MENPALTTLNPPTTQSQSKAFQNIQQLQLQWKSAAGFFVKPMPLDSTENAETENTQAEFPTRLFPPRFAQLANPEPEIPTPVEGPRLRTEPLNPDEKPFTPTRVQLQKASKFIGRSSPAVSIITPSAYGLPFRSIGVGAGYQARTRFSTQDDAGIGAGFGLGDPRKAVGLNIGVISYSTFRSGFFQRGTINFKVNRYLPYDLAIAAGVNNGLTWGATDSSVSPYGVVTKQFILRQKVTDPLSRLYVSAGVGSGQFRPESDVLRRANTVGAFGSVGLRIAEPISLISEWSGQDLTLGLSIAPFRKFPLVITPAVTDITGTAGNGSRFIVGIGYGFKF